MKLPAFYVLDAISKNVFDPYAAKFSAFVVALFLDTYSQVDQTTRSKMEEMLERTDRLIAGVKRGLEEMHSAGSGAVSGPGTSSPPTGAGSSVPLSSGSRGDRGDRSRESATVWPVVSGDSSARN